ncbi:MAG TPA: ATP-binding cassette domain-containing protein [Chthoniobacter sp.]
MNPPSEIPVELRNVFGSCSDGTAINDVSATFAAGKLHILRGMPESGKAALFRFAGLLEEPAGGEVLIEGRSARGLAEQARTELRTQRMGFAFAAPFLLGSFSVIENVAMPLFKISHVGPEEARRRTEAMLAFVGLSGAAERRVDELVPSAQYHVAVARGLVNDPAVLMVENLDGTLTGIELEQYLTVLRNAAAALGPAIIATASPALKVLDGDRVLDIHQGAIARDSEFLPEAHE